MFVKDGDGSCTEDGRAVMMECAEGVKMLGDRMTKSEVSLKAPR